MIPGNELILKCPYCQAKKTVMSLISGNSGETIKWSDGYIIMPMYPRNSEIQQCDKCGKYFWLNDQNKCGHTSSMSLTPSLLTLSQWYDVLDQIQNEKLLNKEIELLIRLHILWCYNHTNQPVYNRNEFEENANRLLVLLNRDGEENLIMSAEIYRELGYYNKCLDLLHTDSLNNWGKEVKRAAIGGKADVFILKNETQRYSIFI